MECNTLVHCPYIYVKVVAMLTSSFCALMTYSFTLQSCMLLFIEYFSFYSVISFNLFFRSNIFLVSVIIFLMYIKYFEYLGFSFLVYLKCCFILKGCVVQHRDLLDKFLRNFVLLCALLLR